MEQPPTWITFNGHRYRLMGGKRRYYLRYSTTSAGRRGVRGLHVDVWEFYSGQKVPPGHEVHHRDGNTFNNDFSNLVCLTPEEHAAIPKVRWDGMEEHLASIRPAAAEWHRTPEGRAWHRNHAKAPRQHPKIDRDCARCGRAFVARRQSTIYCGSWCKSQARREASAGVMDGST